MKFRTSRALRLLALLLAFTLVAAACGSDDDDDTSSDAGTEEDSGSSDEGSTEEMDIEGTVNISGSSTVEPISTRVAELFEDVAPAVEVTVDGPGTGDGFKLFCAGETDISDASRAIKDSEAEDCDANGIEYVELKVAFDGIAVMTNPNNDLQCVTFGDLYALLSAEADGVDNWADAQALATELGSSTTFPDAALDISAPGTESGTYDSFIEIVLEDIADERGQEDFIRTDFAGQAEDNVIIQGIAGSDSSLGWVGFAFAEENADVVKALEVDDGESGCVSPTIETIADGSYPVSRSLYIYVNKAKAAENPALEAYVDFYLGGGYTESVTKAFGEAGYVALPDDLKAETDAAWAGR